MQLELDGTDIVHMVKAGKQDLKDAEAERDLVTAFLDTHFGDGRTPFLLVDATGLQSITRRARQLQAKLHRDMPFGAIAAYGVKLPLRILGAVLVKVTTPTTRPTRLFRDSDSARKFLMNRIRQAESPPKEIVGKLTKTVGADPDRLRQLSTEVDVTQRRFGDHDVPAISPEQWRIQVPNAPFTSHFTLLGDDILLSESRGICTEAVVEKSQTILANAMDELGAERMYFIHDTSHLGSVTRKARMALKAQYRTDKKRVALVALVGKRHHTIMLRWLKAIAPKTFEGWVAAQSIESAMQRIREHRRKSHNRKHLTDGRRHLIGLRRPNDKKLTRRDHTELVQLIEEQRTKLNTYERLVDILVERMGLIAWGETTGLPPLPDTFDGDELHAVVLSALEVMEADLIESANEANVRMKEVEASEARLALSQSVAGVGGFEWDGLSDTFHCSEQLFHIFGFDAGTHPPKIEQFLTALTDRRLKTTADLKAFVTKSPADFESELVVLRLDGDKRTVSIRGRVETPGTDETTRHVYGTVHDITEIVRAQKAELKAMREKRRQNEALHRTLIDLSHDVRTPLASLKLGLSSLGQGHERGWVGASLRAEVEYLDGLFANLMSVLRYRSESMEHNFRAIDPQDVIDRVITRLSVLAADKNISLASAGCEEPLTVMADALTLEQALANVTHNAIKYAEANVAVLLVRRNEDLVIEVRDDGPGVSNLTIPKLTNRYFRDASRSNSSNRGLGLGLSITRAITTDHKGTLTIQNEERSGTLVQIRLPLAAT